MHPAAASTLAPDWLHRTWEATVLAALPRAVYLHAGAWTDVLCILDADALRLPNSVLVPSVGIGRGEPLALGLRAGDRVKVDAGRIDLPSGVVECRRTFRPAAIALGVGLGIDPTALGELAQRLKPGLPGMTAAAHEVVAAASEVAATSEVATEDMAGAAGVIAAEDKAATAGELELRRLIGELVGCGPGLTPTGDDVLAGVLLGLRAAGLVRAAAALADAIAARLRKTTSLSAALLQAAAGGWCIPEVRDACFSLRAGNPDDSFALLSRIGHSSGHDLATGFLAVLPQNPQLGAHTHLHPGALLAEAINLTTHTNERTLHV